MAPPDLHVLSVKSSSEQGWFRSGRDPSCSENEGFVASERFRVRGQENSSGGVQVVRGVALAAKAPQMQEVR